MLRPCTGICYRERKRSYPSEVNGMLAIAKNISFFATLLGLFVVAVQAKAAVCPSTIKYADGKVMKSGSTLYYNNGNLAKSGATTYYPDGQYLQSGETFYYDNGKYFKLGLTLYYSNGKYLRSGGTWFYDSGEHLKLGSTFFYSDGKYARLGSTLYRADGTRTEFPVTIQTFVSPSSTYEFFIEEDRETITARLNRFVDSELAFANLSESGDSFLTTFVFKTGHPGEDVFVDVESSGEIINCVLGNH
jgi:hypothetical protein